MGNIKNYFQKGLKARPMLAQGEAKRSPGGLMVNGYWLLVIVLLVIVLMVIGYWLSVIGYRLHGQWSMVNGQRLTFNGFVKQQNRGENGEHHAAGLGVEGVLDEHGEEQQQDEGEIDEGDAFRHGDEGINQQEAEVEQREDAGCKPECEKLVVTAAVLLLVGNGRVLLFKLLIQSSMLLSNTDAEQPMFADQAPRSTPQLYALQHRRFVDDTVFLVQCDAEVGFIQRAT